jgi:hypothetical protein
MERLGARPDARAKLRLLLISSFANAAGARVALRFGTDRFGHVLRAEQR